MNNSRVLWLGFAVPDELAKEIFSLDPMPAIQTHKFGWSFARTLGHVFREVTLASACPVQSYPLVKRLFFRGRVFTSRGINGVLLGFVNIILLKHLTRFVACLLSVPSLIKRHRINWIFVHGVHTPYLVFGLLARLKGLGVVIVLTDPPGMVVPTDGRFAQLMKALDSWLIGHLLKRVDAVIALAPGLIQRLAQDRPSLVFPGILDSTLDFSNATRSSSDWVECGGKPFTIVYAGGLSHAYGVDQLVDAVLGFGPGVNVRLKLFGRGDQEDLIRRHANQDPRIIYGGFVDAATLLPELCSADILINPRPTSEQFAAMSFPSKLIEYLATSRPVLTTRIPSIPKNLEKHFYFIDEESPEGIRAAVFDLMSLSVTDRANRGVAAQKFVLDNFSEKMTGEKISEFLGGLNLQHKRIL